jgi:hypothetical protein
MCVAVIIALNVLLLWQQFGRSWDSRMGRARTAMQARADPRHETIEHSEPPVNHWRASRLGRLGIPAALAEVYAARIDWHQVARLIERGCPPRLALRIVGWCGHELSADRGALGCSWSEVPLD